MKLLLLILSAGMALGQTPAPDESLSYAINWPSGLSLGEGQITSRKVSAGTELHMTLQAAVPGTTVRDDYSSLVDGQGCSLEFTKQTVHGDRKTSEKVTFDPVQRTMTRKSLPGGGSSEAAISECPHDALAFLFFLRKELAGGRLPPEQTVYFGAGYQVQVAYGGSQSMSWNESTIDVDRLTGTIKGPASENSFEASFTRDDRRLPILFKVPFDIGTFSMELVP